MSVFKRVTILMSHHHSGGVEVIVISVVVRRVRFIEASITYSKSIHSFCSRQNIT